MLNFMLIVAIGLMSITTITWFDDAEAKDQKVAMDELSTKIVGHWEQPIKGQIIEMDLDENYKCRYAFRDSDRLEIFGTWKVEAGRLILHIDRVNEGATFRVGGDVTLGAVLSVDARTLVLGNEEKKMIFRRRR